MNYKKFQQISMFFLFLSIFVVSSLSLSAADETINKITEGDWFEYLVLDASNTTNDFYGSWPPGMFYGNWSIMEGEKIKFIVLSIEGRIRNCSLILGNYSFENIRDIDAAVALTFSIYPWNGGFIANASEWDKIEQQIENTNTTQIISKKYEHIINNTSEKYRARIFNTTDYNGQKSLFHYHDETGVLLEASTSFTDYSLHVSLTSTSFKLEDYKGTFSLDFPIYFMIVCVIPIMLIVKRVFRFK